MHSGRGILPPFNRPGLPAQPRALSTELIDQLRDDPGGLDTIALQRQVAQALRAGRGNEFIPFTGQSAGLIGDILPAAEIIRRVLADARTAADRIQTVLADAS